MKKEGARTKLIILWSGLIAIALGSIIIYKISGGGTPQVADPCLRPAAESAIQALSPENLALHEAIISPDPMAQTDESVTLDQLREEKMSNSENMEGVIHTLTPDTVLISTGEEISFDSYYRSYPIVEGDWIYERIYGKSYVDNPHIKLSNLSYLRIPHYDYDHQIRLGELIVNVSIEDRVRQIFETLYENEYEIESMRLIDDYWTGDGESSDTMSISYNNSSGFCYRLIAGTSTLSNHAYGRAIDINPKQNPYIRFDSKGNMIEVNEWDWDYMDRESGKEHMILKGDICESTFRSHGFTWGGDWKNPIDYQHFEY